MKHLKISSETHKKLREVITVVRLCDDGMPLHEERFTQSAYELFKTIQDLQDFMQDRYYKKIERLFYSFVSY